MNRIRVLVVEDSTYMQEVVSKTLQTDPNIQVVGMARTGREAISMTATLQPDVVTLDVILPDMDGLEVLWHLVHENSRCVIILSAVAQPESAVAIRAFDGGAIDCIEKPNETEGSLAQFKESLLSRVREIGRIDQQKLKSFFSKTPPKPVRLALAKTMVVIGSSAGGPVHLREIVPKLPADLAAAVLVVQHLPIAFTRQMTSHLAAVSEIRVKVATPGDVFVEGTVYVAPGDQVLKVEWVRGGWGAVGQSTVNASPTNIMPWIDASMATAALLYGRRCIGVLLSGMGSDGVEGMRKIKEAGGVTMAQDEKTSFVYGMPKAAADAKVVDRVLPIQQITPAIVSSVRAVANLAPR